MRNRYLDLLRAAATVRVVLYHSTGWAALTVVFPAMSVMFALAGSMMAASLDRHGAIAVERRLHRLLPALWALVAVAVPMMLLSGMAWDWKVLLWAFPIEDPPATGFWLDALAAMWYLRDFLWFVLLSPLLLPLFRRFPLTTLSLPYGALALITVTGATPHPVLRDLALYGGAWLLGFAHHDGLLARRTSGSLMAAVRSWPAFRLSAPSAAHGSGLTSSPSRPTTDGPLTSGPMGGGPTTGGPTTGGPTTGGPTTGGPTTGGLIAGDLIAGSPATGGPATGGPPAGGRIVGGGPIRGASLARYRWWIVGVLTTTAAAWALTHPGPRGFDLNDIPLANALWSAAFILVGLSVSPRVAPSRGLTVLNARALTIYLWHVPLIIIVVRFAEATGLPVHGWVGIAWRLAVVSVLLAIVVMLIGWVEDLSAGRRPALLPGAPRRLAPVSPAPAGRADPQRAEMPSR